METKPFGNIQPTMVKGKLTLTIDMNKNVGRTTKDTGDVICSTNGYIPVCNEAGEILCMLSVHAWKKDPATKKDKQPRRFAV